MAEGLGQMNVLVADDNEHMRQLFSHVLNSLGFSCDTVSDGRECLIQFLQGSYDVVFLDLVLPELDGDTVLRWLKSQSPKTDVIVASQQDDEGIIRQILSSGATAYLIKPFTSREIRGVMNGIMNRRTAAGLVKNVA